jgi:hypothetical protein
MPHSIEATPTPTPTPRAESISLEGGGTSVPCGRLTSRTIPIDTVDAATRTQAFDLFEQAYDGADRERFARDFSEKQLVILLHDRRSGALKGFSTIQVRPLRVGNDQATLVFSGDTVVDRAYWGQKQLQLAFARVLAVQKLRAPRRAVYWFLVSKGWRTYLLLANAFPHAVPRFDRADDVALRAILECVARDRFSGQYDGRTGVVRYATAHERVRTGVAPLTPTLLANPHIRFFAAKNPGHESGDELACLAEVRLMDLARSSARFVAAIVRRGIGARPRTGRVA